MGWLLGCILPWLLCLGIQKERRKTITSSDIMIFVFFLFKSEYVMVFHKDLDTSTHELVSPHKAKRAAQLTGPDVMLE